MQLFACLCRQTDSFTIPCNNVEFKNFPCKNIKQKFTINACLL